MGCQWCCHIICFMPSIFLFFFPLYKIHRLIVIFFRKKKTILMSHPSDSVYKISYKFFLFLKMKNPIKNILPIYLSKSAKDLNILSKDAFQKCLRRLEKLLAYVSYLMGTILKGKNIFFFFGKTKMLCLCSQIINILMLIFIFIQLSIKLYFIFAIRVPPILNDLPMCIKWSNNSTEVTIPNLNKFTDSIYVK